MTSLSYSSDHMMWKQRIGKESRAQTRAFRARKKTLQPLDMPETILPSNPNLLRDVAFHHTPQNHGIISQTTVVWPLTTPHSPRLQPSSPQFLAESRGKYSPRLLQPVNDALDGRPATSSGMSRRSLGKEKQLLTQRSEVLPLSPQYSPRPTSTWKSTQHLLIQDLERTLRQERKVTAMQKRIVAETRLSFLSKKEAQ